MQYLKNLSPWYGQFHPQKFCPNHFQNCNELHFLIILIIEFPSLKYFHNFLSIFRIKCKTLNLAWKSQPASPAIFYTFSPWSLYSNHWDLLVYLKTQFYFILRSYRYHFLYLELFALVFGWWFQCHLSVSSSIFSSSEMS